MGGSHSDRLTDFRAEVRAWFEEHFPASLRNAEARRKVSDEYPIYPTGEDFDLWKARLIDKGWGTPGWPVDYGGGGLDPARAQVVWDMFDDFGAFNPMSGVGTWFLGDTLLEYGSQAQKKEHLTRISRGQVRWCQGFSEPSAGSDLAALSTSAVPDGDDFILNGQKIWTSEAHDAQWMFCLVRTDNSHKQKGISFLILPMDTPGIEIRPIHGIWGETHFNEVFFDKVRVPQANLVGGINRGWSVAKYLLEVERNPSQDKRQLPGDHRPLREVAKEYLGGIGADLRQRLIALDMDQQRLDLARASFAALNELGQAPLAMHSVLKNANAEHVQACEEVLIEILGHQGLGWDGASFSELERATTRTFLHNKAKSIYSGSTEIQLNVIAAQALGLSQKG